jgi:hypothetical protein
MVKFDLVVSPAYLKLYIKIKWDLIFPMALVM